MILFVVLFLSCVSALPNTTFQVDLACQPDFVRCLCGSATDLLPYLTTTIKSCFDNISKTCQTCKYVEMSNVCRRYAQCKTCGEGLDRCLTCPPQKYGQWCDKNCLCENDGACNMNGECICQQGFSGKKCEILTVSDDNFNIEMSVSKRRVVRQAQNAKCRTISSPYNGVVQMEADPKPGSVAKYICNDNYTIIGSRSRTCLPSGLWSGETPTCERVCAFPETSSNLNVNINPNRAGPPLYDSFGNEILSELVFNCTPGFTLTGARVVRCAGGIWDHKTPTCQIRLMCEDPGEIWHGSRSLVVQPYENMFPMGAQINYKCDSSFTLIGDVSSTCTARGTWSSPPPACIPNVTSRCTFTCLTPEGIQQDYQQLKQPLTCSAANWKDDVFVLQPDTI